MAWRKEVEIGQRFRSMERTTFGAPNPFVWQVTGVFEGTDKLLHARLVCITDACLTKTVAVSALLDRRLYESLPPAPPVTS